MNRWQKYLQEVATVQPPPAPAILRKSPSSNPTRTA
jgi:hypothetical protein